MRTAIEILAEIYECTTDGEDLQMEITLNPAIKILEKAINEARKEAINECAEKATIDFYNYDNKGNIINVRGMGFEVSVDGTNESDYIATSKQSILRLINEVK
jgi:hypothetical protein